LYGLICRGAKIILGADITNEVEGYWSNRLWLTLGCGGFFMTSYVPGIEKYFKNKTHLLIEEYLSKPAERLRIARQGYEFVHKHHTFHHFAERVLNLYAEARN
jgi:spore maturation protein CgeB